MFHKIVTLLEIAKYIYEANVTVTLQILNSSICFLFKWLGNLPELIKNSAQGVLCGQLCSGVSAVSSTWNVQKAICETGFLKVKGNQGIRQASV